MYKDCNLPGFEGLYHIYPDGSIYSIRKKRLLKQRVNGTIYPYYYVCLTDNKGNHLTTSVHRIVAIHYISPQPKDCPVLGRYEVNHIDSNSLNNHYSNLEWITHSKNMEHARNKHGNWLIGLRKPGFKMSEESKKLMAVRKYKKVLLFNDNEEVICNSCEEAVSKLNTYRRKFDRYSNTNKTLNGFKIKVLGVI